MDVGRGLHHAAPVKKVWALAIGWGLALILGAAWLQKYRPRDPLVARVLISEVTHVSAHLALYGVLTALVWLASSGRRVVVVGTLALVALLQEGAQSVLYGRTPGRGEAFDLCVDALSVAVVLTACRRFAHRSALHSAP